MNAIMQNPLFVQPDAPPAYLPKEYILSIKAGLEAKQRLLESLPAEIEELSKKYAAAIVFAPPGFDPNESAAPMPTVAQDVGVAAPSIENTVEALVDDERSDKPIGWRKGLLTILEGAVSGLPHKQLLQMAREKYQFPPSNGEKAFYNAVAKLVNAGAVVKHGNLLFAEKVMKEITSKGVELPLVSEMGRRAGSSAELIHKVLAQHPDGLSGPDLRNAVAELPEAPKSLREHGQYVYNVLGTMMGAGEVLKVDGVYRLATARSKA